MCVWDTECQPLEGLKLLPTGHSSLLQEGRVQGARAGDLNLAPQRPRDLPCGVTAIFLRALRCTRRDAESPKIVFW